MKRSESGEQEAVIEYCDYRGIDIVHIPNEGKRSKTYGALMKRMGLKSGFPDLFLPKALKGYHGLFIELKADSTKRPTVKQLEWLSKLNQEGYCALVCYGADSAINEIEKYLSKR